MKRKKNYSSVGMAIARAKAKLAAKHPKHKKARKARKARRAKSHVSRMAGGLRTRPVIYVRRGKFYRGKRSKVFGKHLPARVNPRHRKMHRRHNGGMRSLLQMSTIVRLLEGGLGFLSGILIVNLLGTGAAFGKQLFTPPDFLQKARPVYGAVTALAGLMLMKKSRSKHVQDIAAGLTIHGGFDVVVQMLGLAGVSVPMLSGPIDFGEAITTAPGSRFAVVGDASNMDEVNDVLAASIA